MPLDGKSQKTEYVDPEELKKLYDLDLSSPRDAIKSRARALARDVGHMVWPFASEFRSFAPGRIVYDQIGAIRSLFRFPFAVHWVAATLPDNDTKETNNDQPMFDASTAALFPYILFEAEPDMNCIVSHRARFVAYRCRFVAHRCSLRRRRRRQAHALSLTTKPDEFYTAPWDHATGQAVDPMKRTKPFKKEIVEWCREVVKSNHDSAEFTQLCRCLAAPMPPKDASKKWFEALYKKLDEQHFKKWLIDDGLDDLFMVAVALCKQCEIEDVAWTAPAVFADQPPGAHFYRSDCDQLSGTLMGSRLKTIPRDLSRNHKKLFDRTTKWDPRGDAIRSTIVGYVRGDKPNLMGHFLAGFEQPYLVGIDLNCDYAPMEPAQWILALPVPQCPVFFVPYHQINSARSIDDKVNGYTHLRIGSLVRFKNGCDPRADFANVVDDARPTFFVFSTMVKLSTTAWNIVEKSLEKLAESESLIDQATSEVARTLASSSTRFSLSGKRPRKQDSSECPSRWCA